MSSLIVQILTPTAFLSSLGGLLFLLARLEPPRTGPEPPTHRAARARGSVTSTDRAPTSGP